MSHWHACNFSFRPAVQQAGVFISSVLGYLMYNSNNLINSLLPLGLIIPPDCTFSVPCFTFFNLLPLFELSLPPSLSLPPLSSFFSVMLCWDYSLSSSASRGFSPFSYLLSLFSSCFLHHTFLHNPYYKPVVLNSSSKSHRFFHLLSVSLFSSPLLLPPQVFSCVLLCSISPFLYVFFLNIFCVSLSYFLL